MPQCVDSGPVALVVTFQRGVPGLLGGRRVSCGMVRFGRADSAVAVVHIGIAVGGSYMALARQVRQVLEI